MGISGRYLEGAVDDGDGVGDPVAGGEVGGLFDDDVGGATVGGNQ